MTVPIEGFSTGKLPSEVAEFLGQLADLLDECVSFGSHVFTWCDKSSVGAGAHHAAIILLYRHVLEMIDAVSVMVRQGAADPCQPQMRSAFEASMGIEYMLDADTDRRALAYQVAHVHRRIADHTRHDPNTEAGKELQRVLDQDKMFPGVKLPPHVSARAIDRLAKVLADPEYTEVDKEWTCVAHAGKGRKGPPPWYSLFGGPTSIRKLAHHLKLGAAYDTLYSDWSNSVHAGGAMMTVTGRDKSLRPLRHPGRAQQVTSLATSFTLRITRLLIDHYVPDKVSEYRKWYMENVRELYQEINRREILTVT